MKKRILPLLSLYLILFISLPIGAQNVGINDNDSTPAPNAILDIYSTTKGVLFPRMTTVQRTTLGNLSPTNGMLVFDTELAAYFYFTNGGWEQLSTGNGGDNTAIGTIQVFAGHIDITNDGGYNSIPFSPIPGYLLCNGAQLDINSNPEYTNLKNVIQEYWGDCNDGLTNTVNLPDLRGVFLRGVNMNESRDPDNSTRSPISSGGAAGNHVGSYQGDVFQNHTHNYTRNLQTISRGTSGGQAPVLYQVTTATTTGASNNSGSETRPKNAYVHYIIKY